MKYLEPNIVVVDDKIEEIQGIIKHYNSLGLGCKYFNSDLIDGVDYPDKEFSDVNLFFLDLFILTILLMQNCVPIGFNLLF